MPLARFELNDVTVFTEEPNTYPNNLQFLCEGCGKCFASMDTGEPRKWRFITSHCFECDPKWGGSFFDLPDRALQTALPRRILELELEQERNRVKS